MKLNARQLDGQLARELATIYLVSGEEPLLVAEAVDQIRARARSQGFDQRDLVVVERGFKWAELVGEADNLSLFSSRRLIELRLPTPRPGEAGGKVLRGFAERPEPDRLIVVVTGKLDAAAARSSWVKAIESAGVLVQVWPIERTQLPDWIKRRASGLQLQLTQRAAETLAERVEGNLLAADQELKKLAILASDGPVDADGVLAAVANNARFDVFRLVDAVLTADARRAFAILAGLRAEGTEPALLAWALGRELCLLARLRSALDRGQALASAFAKNGVWQRRQALVTRALERYSAADLRSLLQQAAATDHVIKGVVAGDSWQALTQLVMLALDRQRKRCEVA